MSFSSGFLEAERGMPGSPTEITILKYVKLLLEAIFDDSKRLMAQRAAALHAPSHSSMVVDIYIYIYILV